MFRGIKRILSLVSLAITAIVLYVLWRAYESGKISIPDSWHWHH